ncbi:hypothetical protein SHIRM173S_07781 [Streptomyces hirsutus]
MPASHSCGASTVRTGASPVWSTATHALARTAIRCARAEPGNAESNSAAVARTLRLRSASDCSRNGSSSGPRRVRSESRNISRSSARSVAQVVASSSRAAAGSRERSEESRATRSAKRPSCQSRRILSVSPGPGSDVPPPGAERRANRQSGLRRASHRPRGPANRRTAGRRSVRPRAASSRAGSAGGGAAKPWAFAAASHWGSSSSRSGAAPRRPPPEAPERSVSSIVSRRAAAGGSSGRGSSGAGRGCSAALAGRIPARRRRVATAAASSRAAGAFAPDAEPAGVRRSVPSRAVVTRSSRDVREGRTR